MKILSGKIISDQKLDNLKKEIETLGIKPILKIIQVGDLKSSNFYINKKIVKAKEANIEPILIKINNVEISENELINIIKKESENTNGIIVQLPLPAHLDKQKILNTIPKEKDVDGLVENNTFFTPATAKGIISLLEGYQIEIKNQIIAVVGQSNLVGKPTADLCESMGATKVYRFVEGDDLSNIKLANILIVAIGRANFIKKENLKKSSIVIDVGINQIADQNALKKIVGDVDKTNLDDYLQAVSPVPGGVGPMTVISLLENVLIAYKIQNKLTTK